MNAIAVVIVTFQGKDWIRPLLDSILSNSMQSSIIVVDNASSDGTNKIVHDEFPAVTLIQLSENLGFGAGNNVGIAHALKAGFEYIFLANQDGVVPPDSIKLLYDFMTENQEYGVATPLHCSPDLEHIDRKTYIGYLSPYGYEYLSDATLGNTIKDGYSIRGINAAAWFVRADVFRRVGGFDPMYFMYGEDDDLIARFHYHQVPFALVPSARFVHLRQSASVGEITFLVNLRRAKNRARAALLTRIKHPGISLRFGLSILFAKGLLQPFSEFVVKRDITLLLAHFLATFGLLLELPTVRNRRILCESQGPHFLSSSHIDPADGFSPPSDARAHPKCISSSQPLSNRNNLQEQRK